MPFELAAHSASQPDYPLVRLRGKRPVLAPEYTLAVSGPSLAATAPGVTNDLGGRAHESCESPFFKDMLKR